MTIAEAVRTTSPRRLGAVHARDLSNRSTIAASGGRYRIVTAACRADLRGTPRGPKVILQGKFVRHITGGYSDRYVQSIVMDHGGFTHLR